MEVLKTIFWFKLALIIATAYLITMYIFDPSKNQCQMTFMMEPPRFIQVPIDEIENSILDERPKTYLSAYKLFMYSEIGFPQESDIRRDLRDSMPVLFVPGNAGSYQQVRSLASTCIRRQLQSLDAYKFIFYTIDFKAELSAISGDLIANQIEFVHFSLNQISRLHPAETNGVIVIGHSVGGFLTKALFTRPNFDASSVPLLISLASPLTKPYLNFDETMRYIYTETRTFWSKKMSDLSTISISVSGGHRDRLVPIHSSLDSDYDLSLTTGSIQDVWLDTDHVCITWCRELMQKLASALSSIMDKKSTKIVAPKRVAIKKITETLLTQVGDNGFTRQHNPAGLAKFRRIVKPTIVRKIFESEFITRSEMMDNVIILDFGESFGKDVILWIEYIDQLKDSGLFGCSNLEKSSIEFHTTCTEKINLLETTITIPSRKYEPKKKLVFINSTDLAFYDHVVIDFNLGSGQTKVPESIHVQVLTNFQAIPSIRIPTMFEYYLGFVTGNIPINFSLKNDQKFGVFRYKLDNLKYANQHYNVFIESKNCDLKTSVFPDAIVLFLQDGFIADSFRPEKGQSSVIFRLNSQKLIIQKDEGRADFDTATSLNLFLDGTCENSIQLKFNWFAFIEMLLQSQLGKILSLCCYLSHTLIVWHFYKLASSTTSKLNPLSNNLIWSIWMLTNISIFMDTSNDPPSFNGQSSLHDQIIQFSFMILISLGLVFTIEFSINRIVDLAIIIHNVQINVGNKINRIDPLESAKTHSQYSSNGLKDGASRGAETVSCQNRYLSLDWVLLSFAVLGSIVLSTAVMSVYMMLILIKLQLCHIFIGTNYGNESSMRSNTNSKFLRSPIKRSPPSSIQDVTVSIATLCAIGLIANIPNALLTLNKSQDVPDLFRNLTGRHLNFYFFSSLVSNIMIIYCAKILTSLASSETLADQSKTVGESMASKLTTAFWHLIAVVPISRIDRNILEVNTAQMITIAWSVHVLTKLKVKSKLKHG